MTLADRITELLSSSNMKKVHLANAMGVPRATVTDWTSGKTKVLTYDKLVPVAKFFGVCEKWLNTGKGPKHPDDGIERITITDILPERQLYIELKEIKAQLKEINALLTASLLEK